MATWTPQRSKLKLSLDKRQRELQLSTHLSSINPNIRSSVAIQFPAGQVCTLEKKLAPPSSSRHKPSASLGSLSKTHSSSKVKLGTNFYQRDLPGPFESGARTSTDESPLLRSSLNLRAVRSIMNSQRASLSNGQFRDFSLDQSRTGLPRGNLLTEPDTEDLIMIVRKIPPEAPSPFSLETRGSQAALLNSHSMEETHSHLLPQHALRKSSETHRFLKKSCKLSVVKSGSTSISQRDRLEDFQANPTPADRQASRDDEIVIKEQL